MVVGKDNSGRLPPSILRGHARTIWQTAIDAVRPEELIRAALSDPALPLLEALAGARRILVVGGGKASGAMSAGVEAVLAQQLDRLEGLVNVPADLVRPLRAIQLHAARPAGTNEPTAEGVAGACRILDLVAAAGPEDIALCFLSGGGSALLPAPVPGVTLEDKQQVTRLLHASGATINEMNAVRKHLSRIKGGLLAQAFQGRALFSLIISDVVGDPLDVIASGPTTADPTTFADALAVLKKYRLIGGSTGPGEGSRVPASVLHYLEEGAAGRKPETLKTLPANTHNLVIGNCARGLAAARAKAKELGYRVLDLGAYIEGETRDVGLVFAGLVRSTRADAQPLSPPLCILSGGETTVTLGEHPGVGGRNQEFVLAVIEKLGRAGLRNVVVLSGGTDGEDGPTDAAGAIADEQTLDKAESQGLVPAAFLARHDAYHFFEATGDLLKTGLTQTNVMDVRVILVK
jgi:hydroxypyruvate reductase/glycerate 2-kinase